MKLSFITDEATQSLREAIALAQELGLDGLELRSVEDTAVDAASEDTLRRWHFEIERAGLSVCNLAGSFNKCRITAAVTPEPELQKLERLCRAADILDCTTIRGFAFFADPSGPAVTEQMTAAFSIPAQMLRKRGKKLLLEADPTVNTTNHAALARLLDTLDTDYFGAIYDPGNDVYDPSGEIPFPDGYFHIRKHLAHVHIKDAVLRNGKPECVKIGTGLVDYPALLRQLKADGYDGWLSLETHYRKGAVLTETQMRLPQGAAFSHGGREALIESAQALKYLLSEA